MKINIRGNVYDESSLLQTTLMQPGSDDESDGLYLEETNPPDEWNSKTIHPDEWSSSTIPRQEWCGGGDITSHHLTERTATNFKVTHNDFCNVQKEFNACIRNCDTDVLKKMFAIHLELLEIAKFNSNHFR